MSNKRNRLAKKIREQERRRIAISQGTYTPMNSAVAQGVSASVEVSASYSGPIPPPAMMRDFNDVVPGAADRILTMAENQSNHRMTIEKKVLDHDVIRSYAGLAAGTIVSLAFLGGGLYAALNGSEKFGIAAITGTLGTLATTFIYGKHSQRLERQSRLQAPKRK